MERRTHPGDVSQVHTECPPCLVVFRAAMCKKPWCPTGSLKAGHSAAAMLTDYTLAHALRRFYEDRGHVRLPSASLVPEDPTVLLTIAGMLQFKAIFLGKVLSSRPARAAVRC